MEEGTRKVDGTSGDRGPGKVVAGEQRRGILWVGQVDVQEDTLEEDEDADCEDDNAELKGQR